MLPRPTTRLLVLALAGVAFALNAPGTIRASGQGQPGGPRALSPVVDLVAFERDGQFAENLRAGDFTVTVDGERRTVRSVRRVSRGPGAVTEAAARQAGAEEGAVFSAEAERTVLVVIDQGSIPRGDERAIVQAAGSFLDRLGLTDRVAVLRIPLASDAAVAFTTERPEARLALSRVVGQLVAAAANDGVAPPPALAVEPDRMTGLDPDTVHVDPARPGAPLPAAEPGAGVDSRRTRDSLSTLADLFKTLRTVPGRKVVALFSVGLPAAGGRQAEEEAALSALAAHAVVYAFGAASSNPEARATLATGPLERLAAATGGSFASLGKSPERAMERAVRDLAACYVLSLEPAASDARGGRHRVRVEATRKGVTVRAGAWFVPVDDGGDAVPALARPAPHDEAGPPPGVRADARPARPAEHEAELQVALARLFEYADGYERQYAMLVAEEDYRQSASKGGVHLRSDLLLVRPGTNEEWMSFRDVFEVDGRPVRDRADRLRRLFLEASPEARARLEAIRDESARYNIGAVERTINIPLLPLTFLRKANRARFDYEWGGRTEAGGVEAWRVRYTERARPTMVGDGRLGDLPVSGVFLVDALTGAIVETRMEARQGESRAEILVRYRRDPVLGLWVPTEMKESYIFGLVGVFSRSAGVTRDTVEGHATYSNFRRFQVKTEETIAPPK